MPTSPQFSGIVPTWPFCHLPLLILSSLYRSTSFRDWALNTDTSLASVGVSRGKERKRKRFQFRFSHLTLLSFSIQSTLVVVATIIPPLRHMKTYSEKKNTCVYCTLKKSFGVSTNLLRCPGKQNWANLLRQ